MKNTTFLILFLFFSVVVEWDFCLQPGIPAVSLQTNGHNKLVSKESMGEKKNKYITYLQIFVAHSNFLYQCHYMY